MLSHHDVSPESPGGGEVWIGREGVEKECGGNSTYGLVLSQNHEQPYSCIYNISKSPPPSMPLLLLLSPPPCNFLILTIQPLGRGVFGSVYKATLANTNQHLAVKLMDQNVLVYELMENRSLQESFFDRKCEELMSWKVRYELVIGVAKGLEYLYHFCSPPVIHGDIKPGNILLDSCFNAKIRDFGLERLKIDESNGFLEKKDGFREDNGSILEETESAASGCGESGIIDVGGVVRSPESFGDRVLDSDASPEMCSVVSPEVGLDKGSISEAGFDKMSVDSGRDLNGGGKKGGSRRDRWWKQDNGGGSESGSVKDYVMDWTGSEINKERPKQRWNAASPIFIDNKLLSTKGLKSGSKKRKKILEWWASLDEEGMKKNRKPR
ncbi:hypothetical protein SADUNF_Sadunf02G0125800 [Salix dunnii]|uniref:Protein kinase domain-containing protein n=1 Tax=Salix dunnii TaxID=1413687 RepID=A0A835TJY1_9ROSI|nr:hypothetical protein SADUNF_Sadunf02G0125800 [Salix dunnii]